MEENVALDSKNQKKFVKSIKGIKKLIRKEKKITKNEEKPTEKTVKVDTEKPQKPFSMRLKDGKVRNWKKKEKGLVYLSHIPHGFYEHQMTEYFKQFGVVTNVRVIRSKRTGNSKGYAFVEFKEPSVAEIVAETMNNYLMGKRLIKAAYVPPEKQRRAFRKHWSATNNPARAARLKMKKAHNAERDEVGELKRARKLLANLNKTKKRLIEMGINYDFFMPVDVPEELLDKVIKQEKEKNIEIKDEAKKKTKKEKKAQKSKEVSEENVKITVESDKVENKKTKKKVTKDKVPIDEVKVSVKGNKMGKPIQKVNPQEQKDKQQKMKTAGVKPPEDFVKVGDGSDDDSDSAYDFDSDEYEKVLEHEDEDLSSGEESDDEDGDEDDDEDGDDDESEEEEPPKQLKTKQPVPARQGKEKPNVPPKQVKSKPALTPKPPPPQMKKQEKQQDISKKAPQEGKRKAPQNVQVSPKKPKFEKQNQKLMKKQFKKK